MTTITHVTNQELLYDDMKAAGYVGAMLSSADALLWLSTNGTLIGGATPPAVAIQVQQQAVKIAAIIASGRFRGVFGEASLATASLVSILIGDTILVGTASKRLYTWTGSKWEGARTTVNIVPAAINLPTGLALPDKGEIYLAEREASINIWNGSAWVVEMPPTKVDGFVLSITTV